MRNFSLAFPSLFLFLILSTCSRECPSMDSYGGYGSTAVISLKSCNTQASLFDIELKFDEITIGGDETHHGSLAYVCPKENIQLRAEEELAFDLVLWETEVDFTLSVTIKEGQERSIESIPFTSSEGKNIAKYYSTSGAWQVNLKIDLSIDYSEEAPIIKIDSRDSNEFSMSILERSLPGNNSFYYFDLAVKN